MDLDMDFLVSGTFLFLKVKVKYTSIKRLEAHLKNQIRNLTEFRKKLNLKNFQKNYKLKK
jgi:hypothetical protein